MRPRCVGLIARAHLLPRVACRSGQHGRLWYHSNSGVFGCRPQVDQEVSSVQLPQVSNETRAYRLVREFRASGHLLAHVDPLTNDRRYCADGTALLDELEQVRRSQFSVSTAGLIYTQKQQVSSVELCEYLT